MNRWGYVFRYGLIGGGWCAFAYSAYAQALRSVLPLDAMLLLPSFVFPAGLAMLYFVNLWIALTVRERAGILDPHATVVIRVSPLIIGVRLLLYAAWALSSAWALHYPVAIDGPFATPTFAWVCLGIGVWGLVGTFSMPRVVLEISPAGIGHAQIRPNLIPWTDVADITQKRWLFSRLVFVKFQPEADYRIARMFWQWRKIPRLMFSPLTFGVDPDTLARAFELRRALYVLD
jgi:hypothetical protein